MIFIKFQSTNCFLGMLFCVHVSFLHLFFRSISHQNYHKLIVSCILIYIIYTNILHPYGFLSTVLIKVGSNFEKSSRLWYIFLKAIFVLKKKIKFENVWLGKKPPWVPYLLKEASQKNDFRGGLLFSLFSKNHSNCLKTAI